MLGLATPYKTQNYGTKLQAYAMQTIFSEMGYDTEIINYTHISSKKDKMLTLISPKKVSKKLKYRKSKQASANSPVYTECVIARNKKFDEFVNNNLHTTRNHVTLDSLREYSKRYDAVICGSDQIWLPVHIRQNYYTLSFAPKGTRKIAYAPSFGISDVENADKKFYQKAINNFDFLSCREESGCKLIYKLTNRTAQLVLDPTLMVNKTSWDKMSGNTPIVEGNYIFCYFLGQNPAHRKAVKALSEQTGYKIVCLPYIEGYTESDNDYADISLYDVGPDGFINLIKNAQFICTDSFHGSVFSTIFERQYFVFERFANGSKGSTNTRLESLLKSLHLESRHIKDTDISPNWNDKISKSIDYDKTNMLLGNLKAESFKYIAKALDGIPPKKAKHIELFDKYDCCGCSACSDKCPTNSIAMKSDEEGFLYPEIDKTKCIECSSCIKVCPIKQFRKSSNDFAAFAAKSNNAKIRQESTSGGVFTHLAETIIHNGGVVVGASFDDNFNVRHIIAEDEKDIEKFRSSKYVQSNTQGIYKKVKAILSTGKTVLFSGTPCQIRALKGFLGKDFDNLISVDLFCHGVPSPKIWQKYLDFTNPQNNKISSVSFRDKRISWEDYSLTIKYDCDEKSTFWKNDSYARGFGLSLFNRPSCSKCRLKSFPRVSDITLGDLWLIGQIFPDFDDSKGTSFVIFNNEKGKKLFNQIKGSLTYREIPKDKLNLTYPVMGSPTKAHKNRELFFEQLDSVPFDELVKKYATTDRKREYKIKRNEILNKMGVLPLLKKIKRKL